MEATMVPVQQDIVTVSVLTVNPSSAKVNILCVIEDILSEPLREQAMEDKGATKKDMVGMYRCFRARRHSADQSDLHQGRHNCVSC